MQVSCQVCGNPFQVQPARIKHGRGKTCSADCGGKLVGQRLTKKVALTCKGCGVSFERSPSHVDDGTGKGQYCGTDCNYRCKKRASKPQTGGVVEPKATMLSAKALNTRLSCVAP